MTVLQQWEIVILKMLYISASECDTFGPCLRTRIKLCLTLSISTESPSFAWYYWDRICQRYTHSHYWILRLSKLVLCSAPSVSQSVFTITGKAPTRSFSWLKAPTSAFTFKTLLRHYANQPTCPASRRFQPGEGPSRGLLSDCTTSPINRFAALIIIILAPGPPLITATPSGLPSVQIQIQKLRGHII